MATLRVVPAPDGASVRQNWQVKKNGTRESNHVQKSAAKRKARQLASDGDTLIIHRVNGTIQSSSTYSGSSGGGDTNKSDAPGALAWANDKLDMNQDYF